MDPEQTNQDQNDPAPPTSKPPVPESVADPIAAAPSAPAASTGNTSGQGSSAAVPEEVKGWSWGGFLLSWIWAIGNSVWIGLLALIPYVGFVMSIILGIKGREWAWQSKHWDSVEHFKKVQRTWTIVGVVLIAATVAVIVLLIFVVGLGSAGRFQETQY